MLDAPDVRINAFPPVAEIESMASMVLSDGDRYVGLVQVFAVAGACGAIVGIARRLGLSRRAALFGSLAFATFTVVALQAPTALDDLVVASLLIVCAYFALGSSRAELGLATTALALGVGAKGTAVFGLPVLAAFVLASQPRSRWWSLAAAGAAGLAAGSFWFVLNVVETGDPRGGFTLPGIEPLLERDQAVVRRSLRADRIPRGPAGSPRRSGVSVRWWSDSRWGPCWPSADAAARAAWR